MTEIEQLRADIATLEAAERLASGMPGRSHVAGAISSIVYDKRAQFAKLEAEAAAKADPHGKAKRYVRESLNSEAYDGDIARYARHLEQRVAELQAELAKRPVVWCNRLPEGDCLRDVSGHVKVYTDKEKNDCFLVRGRFEPYTGEQS